uniref:ATP synthase complex subunit 8 n=1 Tax=Tectocoris diophthalmus TaxID=159956 RepID=A0A2P1CLV1_9HEMI|nr:ATP synthase F0 subunit 8 [Tectocoris diophthalmus]
MPQMAPLYWEMLFFLFILSLLLTSIIIYHYPKLQGEADNDLKRGYNQVNWKW